MPLHRQALGPSLCTGLLLAACRASTVNDTAAYETDESTARGTLVRNPPERIASYEPNALTLQQQSLKEDENILDAGGDPVCGVDFHRIEYQAVDPQDRPTPVSGALMVPTSH